MANCTVDRGSIRNGVIDTASKMLLQSGKFRQEEDRFIPTADNANEIANLVNSKFRDMLVRKQDGHYTLTPSLALLDRYKTLVSKVSLYNKDNEVFQLDEETLYEKAGLKITDSADKLFDTLLSEDADTIKSFRRANPDFKFQISEGELSQYDPRQNIVFISLRQINELAKSSNLPFKQVLRIATIHEMAHAATSYAFGPEVIRNKATQSIETLLEKALAWHKKNPFEDKLRQGYLYDKVPYAFSSVHEFAAEAFSNPYFQQWLSKVPLDNEKSVWHKLLNTILQFFGMKRVPDVFHETINRLQSDVIAKENYQNSQYAWDEWDNDKVLYYKPDEETTAQPRTYTQAMYDLFTRDHIKDDVAAIIRKAPEQILKLKQALDKDVNEFERQALQKQLDAYNNVVGKEKEINVLGNMLVIGAQMATDIEDQLTTLNKMPAEKQITLGYSLMQQAKALEFIEPLALDVLSLIKQEGGEDKVTRNFLAGLRRITDIIHKAQDLYKKQSAEALSQELANLAGPSKEEVRLKADIEKWEKELATGTRTITLKDGSTHTKSLDAVDRKAIEGVLTNLRSQLRLIPNKENFTEILAGRYKDSSPAQMYLEAGIANGHPIVNTIMATIRKNDLAVSRKLNPILNKQQTELDHLVKALGISGIHNTEEVYRPITDTVKRADSVRLKEDGTPDLDEKGNLQFEYTEQRMLLSRYSPLYIQQVSEKEATIRHYSSQIKEANHKEDHEAADKYRGLMEKAIGDKQKFYRQYGESKYTEEVMQMYDLLNKELDKENPDGTKVKTTFYAERGSLFDEIEQNERDRDAASSLEEQARYQENIETLYVELGQLRSLYKEDGTPKEGLDLELANIAKEYSEKKNKYGKFIITDKGQASFDREVARLEKSRKLGALTEAQFQTRMSELVITELTPEFFKLREALGAEIDRLTEELSTIPQFESIFKGVNRQRIKDGYEKIHDMVSGFRDNEGVVDGQQFTRIRSEAVKEIQRIQQEVENLRNLSERLKGLSLSEQVTQYQLSRKEQEGDITADELQQLNDLNEKKQKGEANYEMYRELLDKYNTAIKDLTSLTSSKPSTYYENEIEHQQAIIVKEKMPELLEKVRTMNSLEGGRFKKVKNLWVEVISDGENTITPPVEKGAFATVEEAIAHKIATEQAEEEVKTTQWWKDNHFQRYTFVDGSYQLAEVPTYIWMRTEPNDPKYIKSQQPSIKFRTYKVYDGTMEDREGKTPNYLNEKFGTMNDGIAVPKEGVFTNDRYEKLKNSTQPKDQAYFRYLEQARQNYYEAQSTVLENKKMGDILPSYAKTHDERFVNSIQAFKGKVSEILKGNLKAGFGISKSTDEQAVLGGSTTNSFAKQRVIPVRFAGRMDMEKQSADIPTMLLAFNIAALEYNEMSKDQPLLESIRAHVEGLPVQEIRKLGHKFSITGLFSAVKSQSVTQQKDGGKSSLQDTVNYVLDTYLYKETKTNSTVNAMGMEVDLHKVSGGVKKLSSKAIFAFSFFGAIKNSIAAAVQGNISANIAKGYYTRKQYNLAHGEALRHVKDYASDYWKFGNKSQIGQELDFFQVVHGIHYNMYGEKTAITKLKTAPSLITAPKEMSEFELQVAQYLAMSKANPVKVKDQWVEFRKAFEIKDGKLQPVEGAEVTDKDIDDFVFRVSYLNRAINGAYRSDERNALQKSVLGDLAFYLNGYLVSGITHRFAGTRYSKEADMIYKGYHTQMVQYIGDLFKYRQNIGKKWATMTSEEKARVHRSLNEIATVIAFAALSTLLGGSDDGDELKQMNPAQLLTLSMVLAVKSETETFIPLPGMGLNEISRKINSPFAALRQVTNIIRLMQNLAYLTYNSDNAYYQHNTRLHNAGDVKAVADMLRLVGYTGAAFDPLTKLRQVQQAQTLR